MTGLGLAQPAGGLRALSACPCAANKANIGNPVTCIILSESQLSQGQKYVSGV